MGKRAETGREHEHSLDNPAEDHPAGARLEAFVEYIGKAYRPRPDMPRFRLDTLAQKFCKAFCPALPLAPALNGIVEGLGIGIVSHGEGWGTTRATYAYNAQIRRWEIHVPPGLGQAESQNVMHEVFEILFWRCFHEIPWWRRWAMQDKTLYYPHDSATEFAFLVVLNPARFTHKARKNNYDLWALEKRCHATAPQCFNALTRFVSLPFPCFHAVLSFSARPAPSAPCLFTLDEPQAVPAVVTRKGLKQAKWHGEFVKAAELTPDQRKHWQPVLDFQRFYGKGASVSVPPCDVVLRARDSGCLMTTARRVAGYGLTGEASVILRPSATGTEVYLQAVPVGCETQMIQYDPLEARL